jgi:predicted Fe-S protein YdhL (DUF1289 family)
MNRYALPLAAILLVTLVAIPGAFAGEATICGVKDNDVCDGGNRQLGDAIKPRRLTAIQKTNIERTKQQILKELARDGSRNEGHPPRP